MRVHLSIAALIGTFACQGTAPGHVPGDAASPAGDDLIVGGDLAVGAGDGTGDSRGDDRTPGDEALPGDERTGGDEMPLPGDQAPPVDPVYWEEDFTAKTVADLVASDGWTVVELAAPTGAAAWEIGTDNPDDFLDFNLDGAFLFADTSGFGIPAESMYARIATPLISLDDDPTLEFDTYDTGLGDTTDVVISTDGSTWVSTSTLGCPLVAGFSRETFACDLVTYANGTVYIGFVYQGDDNAAWHIDNLRLR